jgi:hypothetical protein
VNAPRSKNAYNDQRLTEWSRRHRQEGRTSNAFTNLDPLKEGQMFAGEA